MATRIFIDGEAGTTGLQIHDRLRHRGDIELLSLGEDRRKDRAAREDAINGSDVTILCLPDDAARESVAMIHNETTRIIDASTAHRVAEGWVYGFPELTEGQGARVAQARFVSNPGCFSTGALALIRPLVDAGLLPQDYPVAISAVSGYTGGGKALIAEMESGTAPPFWLYGLDQGHKHLPEMTVYGRLDRAPVFVPSVGAFAQGMIVELPLHLPRLARDVGFDEIEEVFRSHYAGAREIAVIGQTGAGTYARLCPDMHNDTNEMSIHIRGNPATGHMALCAVFDNLGKGASGAAVQNLDLMIGVEHPAAYAGAL